MHHIYYQTNENTFLFLYYRMVYRGFPLAYFRVPFCIRMWDNRDNDILHHCLRDHRHTKDPCIFFPRYLLGELSLIIYSFYLRQSFSISYLSKKFIDRSFFIVFIICFYNSGATAIACWAAL